ncbi:T9SS type A sorting domain-containing protein, partial [Arsenicibacter rosenii]|uniref:T9SS type A sorting domain-containing protein n=1 Tax=Arsenicibacter rosenii TaxID=1750698 RepID=UPI0011608EAB
VVNQAGRTLFEQTRLVDSERHTETIALPTGTPPGVYLLQVRSGHHIKTVKVVRQ